MINVLLFLILFAILFPRSLKFLLALIFIGGVMLLGEVHANEAAHKIIPGNWAPCASLNTSRKRMRSLPPDEPEPVSVRSQKPRKWRSVSPKGGFEGLSPVGDKTFSPSMNQRNRPKISMQLMICLPVP